MATTFRQQLDKLKLRAGEPALLEVPSGAAFGHPTLGRKHTQTGFMVTVFKGGSWQPTESLAVSPEPPAKLQATSKQAASNQQATSKQATPKPKRKAIKLRSAKPLFGNKKRKNPKPARKQWSAAVITSNVFRLG